jgi:hypothetical protein
VFFISRRKETLFYFAGPPACSGGWGYINGAPERWQQVLNRNAEILPERKK